MPTASYRTSSGGGTRDASSRAEPPGCFAAFDMVSSARQRRKQYHENFATWVTPASGATRVRWRLWRGGRNMSRRAIWVILLLTTAAGRGAGQPATGFQEQRRIRQATTLD